MLCSSQPNLSRHLATHTHGHVDKMCTTEAPIADLIRYALCLLRR